MFDAADLDSLIVTGGLERAIISAHPYPVLQIDMEIKGGPTVVSHLVIRAFGICLLRFNAAARAPRIHTRLRIDILVLLAQQSKNVVPMHRVAYFIKFIFDILHFFFFEK